MTMQTLSDVERQSVLRIVAEHKSRPGPLIEILHAVQAELGYVPPAAVPVIALELNLSRAEVHGVVTFYHFFRDHPAGRHIVRLCQAESCRSMGAVALAEHAKARLGIDFHETSADGAFTLEPVYCLGNCACSPALMVDGDLLGRVTAQVFDAMVTARKQSS
jgi:formate dehydrogenase subunit gamma